MPKIKEYVDDSDQDGKYVLANVGGESPVTLQVTDVAEKILDRAGYEPGSNVPTKVTWAMYDVGLLYTSNVVNNPPEVGDRTDMIFQQLGVSNKLNYEEREHLLDYLREYDGPKQDEIASVQDELEQTQSKAESSESDIESNNSFDSSELSNIDDFEISDEMNSVRLELLAYNSEFYADNIQSDLEDGRREIIFFSIENLSNKVIDIYTDEWHVVGQDDFIYDYVQRPYKEIPKSEYPAHYPREYGLKLSPSTKTRYLLISGVLPESIKIRKIEYNHNTSFSLELPDNTPDIVGNPPI